MDEKKTESVEQKWEQKFNELHEKVKIANKVMGMQTTIFENLTNLVKSNYNIWIKHEKGKIVARVSSFQKEEDALEDVTGQTFQEVVMKIAKDSAKYVNGAMDLAAMTLEENPDLSEDEKEVVKKAVLEGVEESYQNDKEAFEKAIKGEEL